MGFVLRKTNYLPNSVFEAMPALLFKLCYPLLILQSVTATPIKHLAGDALLVILLTLGVTLILYLISLPLTKHAPDARRPIYRFNVTVGNLVYVTLPFIAEFFGPRGVVLATLSSTAQDMIIWTLYLAEFNKTEKKKGWRIFASPCFLVLMMGILLSAFGIGIPKEFTAFPLVAGMTTPLGMLYLGAVLAGFDRDKLSLLLTVPVWIGSMVKVMITPLFAGLVMWFVSKNLQLSVMFGLFFSAPGALMSVIWSKEFNRDADYAAAVVLFSTVLFFVVIFAAVTFLPLGNYLSAI